MLLSFLFCFFLIFLNSPPLELFLSRLGKLWHIPAKGGLVPVVPLSPVTVLLWVLADYVLINGLELLAGVYWGEPVAAISLSALKCSRSVLPEILKISNGGHLSHLNCNWLRCHRNDSQKHSGCHSIRTPTVLQEDHVGKSYKMADGLFLHNLP